MKKVLKKSIALTALLGLATSTLAACGQGSDQVVIYSNADEEALEIVRQTLDGNGYQGQYEIQTFGTSELGGRLLAEGNSIEADMITMSSYYIESAQERNNMFVPLALDKETIDEILDYYAPMTAQEGAIIVNEELVKSEGLAVPKSIKDLADPKYAGQVAVVDIESSSTAWLMVQALIDNYGEAEAEEILAGIYKNAGDHIESSGSGPLNKVKAGEVAFGFGLRHQVQREAENGVPIAVVDPTEGNYTLTESLAVIDKGNEEKQNLAKEMINTIINEGRPAIQEFYPSALYQGEESNADKEAAQAKKFGEPLTAELLAKHQELSTRAKQKAAQ